MKKIFLLPFLLLSFNIFAQSEEEKAVKVVIDQMFDAMRAGDSTSLRSIFHPSARLMSVFYNKEGESKIHDGDIDRFIGAVGTPHDEVWDEKIWSYDIQIDGNLASVWTEYSFFLGENLRHCGVNAFHLFKSDDGWLITQITDTRRRENCKTE